MSLQNFVSNGLPRITASWLNQVDKLVYGVFNNATTQTTALTAVLPSQTGNSGKTLTTNGSVASWGAAGSGSVTSVGITVNNFPLTAGSAVTTSGTVSLTPACAKGDVISGTGSNTMAVTNVGSNGQVLSADSTQTGGIKWITVTGTGTVTGPGSSTSTAIPTWNGTGGTALNNSGISIDGSNNMTGMNNIDVRGAMLINTQTAGYTIVLADVGKQVEMNSSSSNALTVPANATTAFPIGSWLNVTQLGTGTTTITAASGVTILNRSGLILAGQYAVATIYKRATDTWVAGGDLT